MTPSNWKRARSRHASTCASRAAPWGKILDVIPRDMTVVAKARTKSWFNVTYEETDGWSAAWLADSDGDCDWLTDDVSGTEDSA